MVSVGIVFDCSWAVSHSKAGFDYAESLVLAAESHVKCILFSFLWILRFRVFTVANFYIIFNSIFRIILTKIVENELKMKSKMSQKWPKNGYREQPYC
jgi:hypothetical protein